MSAKRKKNAPRSGAVWHMSAEEAALAKKPQYNGFACGHGAHGDAKYNRSKSKQSWKAQMEKEGAPRGSLLFHLKTLPINAISPPDSSAKQGPKTWAAWLRR